MANKDENGRGFLFPNSKATEENKQPHLTGELVTPKGEKVKLAAWTNKSKKGDEYLSVAASEPREEQAPF
tara:strand:+ start:680 stop:889 length:210 start_codon:yes stop_codon:yes gene_type:complete